MIEITIFTIGYLIGMTIFSLTMVQILIIIFFGIPITKKLNKNKSLKQPNPIQKGNYVSLLVLTIIFLVTNSIIYYFSYSIFTGCLAGYLTIFLLSLSNIGANKNNISDYIDSNKKYFSLENQSPEEIIFKVIHKL
jgi:hypothetical protein